MIPHLVSKGQKNLKAEMKKLQLEVIEMKSMVGYEKNLVASINVKIVEAHVNSKMRYNKPLKKVEKSKRIKMNSIPEDYGLSSRETIQESTVSEEKESKFNDDPLIKS